MTDPTPDLHAKARMEWNLEKQNREVLNTDWCIVCGQSAAEEHPYRCHAAGGVLAGPFCSKWCWSAWLNRDWLEDHETDERRSYRREATA